MSPTETPAPPADEKPAHAEPARGHGSLGTLALAALGVVFGDIGTSPLYALKECVSAEHGVAPSADNILGLLSLIVWSLLMVVTLKYLTFVMRADNGGEGGILITGVQVNNAVVARIRRMTSTDLILLTQGRLTAAAIDSARPDGCRPPVSSLRRPRSCSSGCSARRLISSKTA